MLWYCNWHTALFSECIMTASASRCIHLISVAFQYSATLQTGGLSINCIYVLSVYPTLTFFISLDFILCGIAFGVNFFIVCRLKICINISNLVLTNCNSCCMISNVSGRQIQNNLHMREWLSWWSTTLPRSGPRVRVPSRALF